MDDELSKEAYKLLPEVYNDLVKPSAEIIGDVTGRSVKALLAPLRGLLWGWERIEQTVTDGINKRFEKIPQEQQKTPDPEIAVPLMQALTYTAQNETLREIYLNLLANSMDTAKEKFVHPSFVELIKQMNSLDAKVFEALSQKQGYQEAINPSIALVGQGKTFVDVVPEWFLNLSIPSFNIFDISTSLIRLNKFGLIELMYDRNTVARASYHTLKAHPHLIAILKQHQMMHPNTQLEITAVESVVYVNEYGKQFKKVCLA